MRLLPVLTRFPRSKVTVLVAESAFEMMNLLADARHE